METECIVIDNNSTDRTASGGGGGCGTCAVRDAPGVRRCVRLRGLCAQPRDRGGGGRLHHVHRRRRGGRLQLGGADARGHRAARPRRGVRSGAAEMGGRTAAMAGAVAVCSFCGTRPAQSGGGAAQGSGGSAQLLQRQRRLSPRVLQTLRPFPRGPGGGGRQPDFGRGHRFVRAHYRGRRRDGLRHRCASLSPCAGRADEPEISVAQSFCLRRGHGAGGRPKPQPSRQVAPQRRSGWRRRQRGATASARCVTNWNARTSLATGGAACPGAVGRRASGLNAPGGRCLFRLRLLEFHNCNRDWTRPLNES